ncbi:family 43 glycosylhydrolase, partial [Bacteroides uniformis]|uniref:family 43 glycosylhydrolase n=1 Tax=Bacteroides uniformis TaxID=820 RepID=UPI00374E16C9
MKRISHAEHVQEKNVTIGNSLVRNGIPWFDDRGNIVNAHGACIVEDGGRYYLFGEWKSDESNAFPGFSCYSSDDLVNWKFENVVLKVQPDGILGPDRVGERVKVMKCPKTGEYVMLMHADDMGYKDPYIGVATCKTINGDYELQGPLLYQGKPVKRWDMGTFQDTDGKGYLLIHHGPICRLSDDYRSVEAEVAYVEGAGESPAMFRKNGVYYKMRYSSRILPILIIVAAAATFTFAGCKKKDMSLKLNEPRNIRGVVSYKRSFGDLNEKHLNVAQAIGIRVLSSREEAEK